jgi:BlaI family transcriptional regulator, penicillinase repressor
LNVRFYSYLRFMKRFKGTGQGDAEPTRTELAILQVLWQHGPSTVRFVHDTLNETKESVQYTSTLKLMQVMAEKGMLTRDETNMKHIYEAAMEERTTKGSLLNRFIDSMYHGSVSNMMVALLGNEKTSAEDLAKVKALLEKMDTEGPGAESDKTKIEGAGKETKGADKKSTDKSS